MRNILIVAAVIISQVFITMVIATPTPGLVGAILQPMDSLMGYLPFQLYDNIPPNLKLPFPDIDLHAYTPDGKHVGVNYTTDIFEKEIPGAHASGDSLNGREWIFIPGNIKVQFVVDSGDNQKFLNFQPGVLEKTNGTQSYNLNIVYDLPNFIRYETSVEQSIQPGAVRKYNYSILKNVDGTYKVVVDGVDFNAATPIVTQTPTVTSTEMQTPNVQGFSLLVAFVSLIALVLTKRMSK